MRHQRTYHADRLASPAIPQYNNLPAALLRAVAAAVLLLAVLIAPSANAQLTTYIRFTYSQDRITVGINTTNTTTITNFANLGGVTNAAFNVSGLPAGTSYIFTDTNGAALVPPNTLTTDTNLWLTVFTTNIPEGLYLFRVNAGGTDTNGQPVTNSFPYLLQAAHLWNGTLNTSNAWSTAGSWLTGTPGAANDVVFTDIGAQTNGFGNPGQSGIPFTNSVVDVDTTVNSLRFAQSGSTNFSSVATNPAPVFHHVQILNGKTLTIAGASNSFSMFPDYFDPRGFDIRPMNVTIDGAGGKLVVTNQNANFSIFSGNLIPTLNMSNLDTFIARVSRIGICDYLLYPNYRDLNTANNEGRDTNTYNPNPGSMSAQVFLAKTNVFSASYKDPNNYTNEQTRAYGLTVYNNEIQGVSSGTAQNFQLGISNIFLMDGICFFGANGAAQGGTGVRFNTSNSFALFRNTNGTSRMSVFTVSDDGGTNEAGGNMKAIVDFSFGTVDILADRLYLSRDRVLISTNQNPNVQATVTFGKGTVDVNTAVLGFQEHTKPDWNVANHGPYLNYCLGDLTVTSNGLFKVNGTLTLGYTADTNSPNDAQQWQTGGRITINSNSIVAVSNIICDGNLNYYDSGNGRPNQITINSGGTLIISNTIGGNNYAGTDLNTVFNTGLPGLPLDNLSMAPASTLVLSPAAGKTNFVRTFKSTGNSQPGIIKIASLPAFTVYPTNVPLIQYTTANPVVLASDMSAIGGNVQGYILNNSANSTIDLFLTTNAPRQLVWTGGINGQWDLTSTNWEPLGGGTPTKYALGDIAIFDDSSSVTTVLVTDTVVPNQATNGVIITNSVNAYTFVGSGGSIAGTAKIIKQGTNIVTFNVAEAGTLFVTAGEVDAGANAILGTTTVYSNALLKVQAGSVVNGVVATNCPLTVANGGTINGPLTLVGGSLVNDGIISTPSGLNFLIGTNGNTVATNNSDGVITINGSGSNNGGEVMAGSTLANFGTINLPSSRLTIDGTYFGTGNVQDTVNSPTSGSFGRLQYANNIPGSLLSVGTNVFGSISNFYAGVRLDMSGNSPQNNAPTFLVELDTINNIYDTIKCVRWNNIGCIWQMTNVNGTFQSGQSFQILVNANGTALSNIVDTSGIYPFMQPTIPGPGLQWNLTGVKEFGTVGVTNSTMVWAGGGGGSWDTNGTVGAWQGKVYSDNQGAIFDDTASGTTTVTINTLVAPAGINITTNIVVGVSTNMTTNTPAFMPGMIVSNAIKDYTFVSSQQTNRITGMTGIYKTGPGMLTILSSNEFTGGLVIDGGTVAITNATALGTDPGSKSAYDQIMMDNSTLRFFGPVTNQTLARGFTLNPDGATIEVSSNGTVLTVSPPSGASIGGPGALTKTGPGVLVLSQAADNYAGGTIVTNGTLRLTTSAAGFGTLTLSNNTSLEITNGFTLTNAVSLPAGGVPIALQGISTNILNTGPWSGGSATFSSTNAGRLLIFNNDITGVGGTLSFGTSIGTFRFNNRTNDVNCLGSAATTFDLGTGSALLYVLSRSNLTYDFGALAGGQNTTLAGSPTNGSGSVVSTFRIGANGANSTFAGTISNGLDTVSVVKVGAGTLLLNGKSIYTGSTTVSNGTLGGTGSIASPLTVAAGATLAPGAPLGTFTVSNTAALNGNVLLQLNVSSSPASNSALAVTGTITPTGTLVVTNVGPDIANGSKFQLFNKLVTGFSSITLPASNPSNTSSYNWQNNIGSDGSITLISGGTSSVNTNPTNMTFSVSGTNLTLTWPGDHLGWQLQSNPISLNSTNWYQIVGSTAVTQENLVIDRSKTNIFFRMIYPPAP
jgi:autotransporter-associated beta strand protein